MTVGGAPSATVFIDGKDMGPAPFKGELSAERHTIEARAPGFVTVGQTVDVQYKQPMSLVLSLSQERHEGKLKVTAPEGAEISIDRAQGGLGHVGGGRVDHGRAPARRDAARLPDLLLGGASWRTTRRAR